MQHKALRLFLVILVSLTLGFKATAQNLTKSPYSIIAIGEMQFQGTSLQSGMGQVAQGVRRSSDINMLNPASYSSLKYTVIDGGILYSQGTLSQGSNRSDIDNSSFSYFMFGVPVSLKHKMGLVFGLMPYSSMGYNVSSTANYPYYTATTQMVGTGGLSKFNIGFGAQVVKNISAGINISYLFGQLFTDLKLLIPSVYNNYNVNKTLNRVISGAQIQGGVQYHKDFELGLKKEKYAFTAGASYTLGASLNGNQEQFVRTMPVGFTSLTRDTTYYGNNEKGTIELPYSLSIGAGWEKRDHWTVAADLHVTNWSAYRSTYRSFGRMDSLQNSLGFNIGGSYIPNATDYKNYFNRVEYRAGLKYDGGNVIWADKNISSYGFSLGMGMPLGKSKSKLNIAGEYYARGTTANNLIKEEYFRIVLGLNFSDRWFQRYKYD
jgi:long-subunit fatty acid transport protein